MGYTHTDNLQAPPLVPPGNPPNSPASNPASNLHDSPVNSQQCNHLVFLKSYLFLFLSHVTYSYSAPLCFTPFCLSSLNWISLLLDHCQSTLIAQCFPLLLFHKFTTLCRTYTRIPTINKKNPCFVFVKLQCNLLNNLPSSLLVSLQNNPLVNQQGNQLHSQRRRYV